MEQEEKLPASPKLPPKPLSAIGRSGTFIIESVDKKQDQGESADPDAPQQPDETPPKDNNGDQARDSCISGNAPEDASCQESPPEVAKTNDSANNKDAENDFAGAKQQSEENRQDEIVTTDPPTTKRSSKEDDLSEMNRRTSPQKTKSAEEIQVTAPVGKTSTPPSTAPPSPPSAPVELPPPPAQPQPPPPPIPAPRKRAPKPRDQAVCRYSILENSLRERWESIESVPKFQPIDSKMRKILDEQLARRLETPLTQESEDLRGLQKQVEAALRAFYDQDQRSSPAKTTDSIHIGNIQGLPSLTFLQWMLPVLDNRSVSLLLGCDME